MLTPFFGFDGLLGDLDNTAPYVHVRETDAAALVELEVPRFRAEDITITPDPATGVVTIVGKRPADSHYRDDTFGDFLFGMSQQSGFRRAVHFSTRYYDVSKAASTLDYGVLTVTVPKLPQEKPVAIMAPPASQSGELIVKTTPEEFAAVAQARWPPQIKRDQTKEEVTYRCELPAAVTKDHIELMLDNRRLTLSVHYAMEQKTKHSSQSQSVTYSTVLGVPEGTQAEDIHTEYEGGVLTIHMKKHEKPGAIPIQDAKK